MLQPKQLQTIERKYEIEVLQFNIQEYTLSSLRLRINFGSTDSESSLRAMYSPNLSFGLYTNEYEQSHTQIVHLHSRIRTFSNYNSRLIHRIHIVFQSKKSCYPILLQGVNCKAIIIWMKIIPMCQHPVIGIPRWQLQRLSSSRVGYITHKFLLQLH